MTTRRWQQAAAARRLCAVSEEARKQHEFSCARRLVSSDGGGSRRTASLSTCARRTAKRCMMTATLLSVCLLNSARARVYAAEQTSSAVSHASDIKTSTARARDAAFQKDASVWSTREIARVWCAHGATDATASDGASSRARACRLQRRLRNLRKFSEPFSALAYWQIVSTCLLIRFCGASHKLRCCEFVSFSLDVVF